MKMRLWIERSLLLAGLFAVGIWAGSIGAKVAWQAWQSHAFDRQVQQKKAQEKKIQDNATASASAQPASPPAKGADGVMVGRLSIPRLGLTAMVREGTGADVLGVAVGHIPGTALPGLTGNVALAGHRDTLFRGLREIKANDLIQLETLAGNYSYRVGSTEIVKPDDVKVLQASSSPELTLVTCYPFNYVGSAPDRFIVKAALVTDGDAPAKPAPVQEISKPAPVVSKSAAKPEPSKPGEKKIPFTITKDHSRQLAPGISLGLTATDVRDHRVDGWMWLMPDRRTVWLKSQQVQEPFVFYSGPGGKKRELEITAINQNSITGFLMMPAE
jgi:sortase A